MASLAAAFQQMGTRVQRLALDNGGVGGAGWQVLPPPNPAAQVALQLPPEPKREWSGRGGLEGTAAPESRSAGSPQISPRTQTGDPMVHQPFTTEPNTHIPMSAAFTGWLMLV